MDMNLAVSIIIVTWNNRDLLGRCLRAVELAVDQFRFPVEVLVVDNGSVDGTKEYLSATYPKVLVISLDENYGFGPATNIGVQRTSAPLVVMLNDDIIVEPNFLKPMAEHFADDNVFAVAPKMILDGKTVGGRTVANFRRGFFNLLVVHDLDEVAANNLLVGGGAGMFRRDYFLSIGGFDSLFWPFYYEDLDICYRAWKRGWKLLAEPKSIIYHAHATTIGKRFSAEYVQAIAERNFLLFHWKNISNSWWLIQHFGFLFYRVIIHMFKLNFKEIRALCEALKYMGPIAERRKGEKLYSKLRDDQVLCLVKNNQKAGQVGLDQRA